MENREVLRIAKELEKKPHILEFMREVLSLPDKIIKKVMKRLEVEDE